MKVSAGILNLTAGIAHEIDNPLASMLANVELSLELLGADDIDQATIVTALSQARRDGGRIREIVQSLKLLSPSDGTKERVDVAEILRHSVRLATSMVRYRAQLIVEIGELARVRADGPELARAFVHLIVDAAQALDETQAAENEVRVVASSTEDAIIVEVTGGVGAESGLGHLISHVIVANHGGRITIENASSHSSTFRVWLPATRSQATEPRVARVGVTPRTARRRLLLIDDEVNLTRALAHVLKRDCDVTVVNHAADAVALLLTEPRPTFDVILCDLMMPEIAGDELYARVTNDRPELADRFAFMTGGAFTTRGREFVLARRARCLAKPFSLEDVRSLVFGTER